MNNKKQKNIKHYKTYVNNSLYKKIRGMSFLKKILSVIFLILVGNFLVAKIFNYNLLEDIGKRVLNLAGVYTEPIPQVSFESDGWSSSTPGSWHVDKSAKWTGFGKAKVTFNLNTILKEENKYKDIVLVLDNSASMVGNKLERVKQDATELIEYLLNEPENKIALISFNSESTIHSYLTNDKTSLLEQINSLGITGNTNYTIALKNALTVLEGYEYKENRELILLFLTDGYPNEETPNQIAEYHILKDKYPFLTINGVQYEMGNVISQAIIDISDNQFFADTETLNNILFEASAIPIIYENFEIVDYIEDEFFYVNDVNDIEVSVGTVKLEGSKGEKQKITWNLGDSFKTGKSATMEINLTLKEEYEHESDLYPTNDSESFKSKLPEEDEETKESELTPVLKNSYKVEYDVNLPKGAKCNLNEFNKKIDGYTFENINYVQEGGNPTCSGYIFKGWEIDDKETGERSKDIQRVNDEVFVMPEHDVVVRGSWSKPVISKAMDGTIKEKLTLYKIIENEFNSESGFAAEYTEGKADDSYTNPDANERIYYYQGAVTNNNVVFGGFCWQMVRTTATGGVKMVYNGLPDVSGKCNNTGKEQQLANTSKFNEKSNSLGYVGYMLDQQAATDYESKSNSIGESNSIYEYDMRVFPFDEYYYTYYSSDIRYYDGEYHIGGGSKMQWAIRYQNDYYYDYYMGLFEFPGVYFCNNEKNHCETLDYLAEGFISGASVIQMKNGETLDDVDTGMIVGKGCEEKDGIYTLTETETFYRRSWHNVFRDYEGYYICGDGSTASCSIEDLKKIIKSYTTSSTNMDMNIKYGSSFTYANGEYTLTDAKRYFELDGDLSNHHYTCLGDSEKCDTIKYIYSLSETTIYTIDLKNGKSVEDALEESLTSNDVNKNDSIIKSVIDTWYAENIEGHPFEKYIEDTIYCNDRSISDLGGWNPNGGLLSKSLYFSAYNRKSRDNARLTCPNEIDKFSISNSKAQLKYPVGLITSDELMLAGNNRSNYLGSSQYWWLGSPYNYGSGYLANGSGYSSYNSLSYDYGVRPAITLRPGTDPSSGDGTKDNPYVVSTPPSN